MGIPYSYATAASGINSSGQVAGWYIGSECRSFLWQRGIGVTGLGNLGGSTTFTFGMSNSGSIVGRSEVPDGSGHPFIWQPGLGMKDLDIPGLNDGTAYDINDVGQVVGQMTTTTGEMYTFIWEKDQGTTSLGAISGDVRAVNNVGQAVGYRYTGEKDGYMQGTTAYMWQAGTGLRDIAANGSRRSTACDINDSGQIAGNAASADTAMHAVLWQNDLSMKDLGTLGGSSSYANGLNNSGQVVGYSRNGQNKSSAFIWQDGIGMMNLNSMVTDLPAGIWLSDATAINDKSWVVGLATAADGGKHLYMLLPSSPEPGSLIVLGTGLVSLASMIRRRR